MECIVGCPVFSNLFRLPVVAHLGAAALALTGFRWIKGVLEASYAASLHPVDYATGQLAFDARLIEGYYARMNDLGTLHIYWRTQFIDFGFIAAVMVVSLLVGTLAARLGGRINRLGIWGWHIGLAAAVLGMTGAAFDALENLLSFAMLARPEAIAGALAFVYSSAAATKFGFLTAAMLALFVSVLAGVAARAQAGLVAARIVRIERAGNDGSRLH